MSQQPEFLQQLGLDKDSIVNANRSEFKKMMGRLSKEDREKVQQFRNRAFAQIRKVKSRKNIEETSQKLKEEIKCRETKRNELLERKRKLKEENLTLLRQIQEKESKILKLQKCQNFENFTRIFSEANDIESYKTGQLNKENIESKLKQMEWISDSEKLLDYYELLDPDYIPFIEKISSGNYLPAGWYVKLEVSNLVSNLMFINMKEEICFNCGKSHRIQIFRDWKKAWQHLYFHGAESSRLQNFLYLSATLSAAP